MAKREHSAVKIRFGDFELDTRAGELRRSGIRLKLQGQPIQVLEILLARPGEVVTQEELRSALWTENTFVDFDHGLRAAVARLRAALADPPDSPRMVETVPRKGYRYIGPVPLRVEMPAPEFSASAPRADEPTAVHPSVGRSRWVRAVALAIALLGVLFLWDALRRGRLEAGSEKRVVAVLPFQYLNGEPEDEGFSKGLTEEIIHELAQLDARQVGVIASSESSRFRGVTEITYALRLDYVVEGTVRREAGRARITVRLIRIQDRTHLWADSFESESSSDLHAQEQVAAQIAASLMEKLQEE